MIKVIAENVVKSYSFISANAQIIVAVVRSNEISLSIDQPSQKYANLSLMSYRT